jgi:hypothetical protein
MKKILTILIVLFITGNALALTDVSLGVYGGLNAPILQPDTKSGTGFGLRAKVAPIPLVAGALFFESRSYGSPTKTVFEGSSLQQTITFDGGKVTIIGIEAMLGGVGGGIGPHFYIMAGLGSYKWKRDNMTLSKMEYHFGPGLEIGFPKFGIEAKGKFEIVPTGGGGSRKNALAYVGANYHFSFGVM